MLRTSLGLGLAAGVLASPALAGDADLRVATFNAFLNRFNEGDLVADLSTPDNSQAQAVAEIIQRINPDVILLNEFDYDKAGLGVELFQDNYLSISQNGADPVDYPFVYLAPSNTGIPSGFDLNNDGMVVTEVGESGYGDDCFGFGFFPGQFAMVLLSKHPIITEDVRTFQLFLWKDMPGALLPDDPDTPEEGDWYSPEELEVFRLSSKSHWDVPVMVDGETVHILCAHPTPPVFDGPEDRNGTRNHDEIRFWADYVNPAASSYIYDDEGGMGGLGMGAKFVIVGDYNSDPKDGDSIPGAIQQITENLLITDAQPASLGGIDAALRQNGLDLDHLGPAKLDTGDFNPAGPGNLRVDYVLPSANLGVVDTAVFWPCEGDPLFYLVGGGFPAVSSDHRPVWADLDLSGPAPAPGPVTPSISLEFIGEATFETGFMFGETEVGGLSGIAYDASIGAYRALSDDRSQINDARFYTLTIDLEDGALADGDVAFKNVLFLQQNDGTVYPEFSLDPEGLAFSASGDLYVCSEGDANNGIDPFVDIFTPIGRQLEALPVPGKYLTGTPEFGIRNNLAFESLTLTPDELTLFTATENALFQDGPAASLDNGSPARILAFDLETGDAAAEFVYEVDAIPDAPMPKGAFATNGLVELLALSDTRLLALERSFSVGVGNGIRLYEVSIDDADDVSALEEVAEFPYVPASKQLLFDLGDLGITLDNVEGVTFGPRLPDGRRSLILVSDNNFNPNGQFTQFLAFAIDECGADFDGDGEVNAGDLATLLAAWGANPGSPADLDGDGMVGAGDLAILLAAWGDCF